MKHDGKDARGYILGLAKKFVRVCRKLLQLRKNSNELFGQPDRCERKRRGLDSI